MPWRNSRRQNFIINKSLSLPLNSRFKLHVLSKFTNIRSIAHQTHCTQTKIQKQFSFPSYNSPLPKKKRLKFPI